MCGRNQKIKNHFRFLNQLKMSHYFAIYFRMCVVCVLFVFVFYRVRCVTRLRVTRVRSFVDTRVNSPMNLFSQLWCSAAWWCAGAVVE